MPRGFNSMKPDENEANPGVISWCFGGNGETIASEGAAHYGGPFLKMQAWSPNFFYARLRLSCRQPHSMLDFPTMIAVMIVAALALTWWNAARAATERAIILGRAACERAGAIWVDQTVHATGLHLYRRDNGRLGVERRFRFEYSWDGHDRHPGQVVLRGEHLVSLAGPSPPEDARYPLY